MPTKVYVSGSSTLHLGYLKPTDVESGVELSNRYYFVFFYRNHEKLIGNRSFPCCIPPLKCLLFFCLSGSLKRVKRVRVSYVFLWCGRTLPVTATLPSESRWMRLLLKLQVLVLVSSKVTVPRHFALLSRRALNMMVLCSRIHLLLQLWNVWRSVLGYGSDFHLPLTSAHCLANRPT